MTAFSKRLRRWELALLLGLALAALLGARLDGAQGALADKVLRLHVLANSDSQADQALKLQVRDAVLEQAEGLLAGAESRAEAEALLAAHLPSLAAAGEGEKLVLLHYPPVYPGARADGVVELLREFGVKQCFYGHLHGSAIRFAVQGWRDEICYKLVSADALEFCPWKIS